MAENIEYKNIFKSTFLFGFVQLFNIILKVVLNKTAALLLGAAGMGVIGLFQNSMGMLNIGAGLGISQSAVRDISEAKNNGDLRQISLVTTVTKRIVFLTGLLGILTTIILSSPLSIWSFGNSLYISSFILLSIAVGITIITEGQLAILKGLRKMKYLAKASMIGSFAGLIFAIPLYWWLGLKGIVPSLIIAALAPLVVSLLYVKKLNIPSIAITWKQTFSQAQGMIKMGMSLMLVSFLSFAYAFIISSYISHHGGLGIVGFYQAGVTIIASYFGIVLSAMSTDYYPRISAVHRDNLKLEVEMNRQSETSLLLISPLVILFIFLSSQFVYILYSSEFEPTNDYTNYALIGTIITSVSNCMGMILLAKQSANVFLVSVIGQRIVNLFIYIFLYNTLGLLGLGIAYTLSGVIHLSVMWWILRYKYSISLNRRCRGLLFLTVILAVLTIGVRTMTSPVISYTFGTVIFCLSLCFSIWYMKKYMGIDLINLMFSRFRR